MEAAACQDGTWAAAEQCICATTAHWGLQGCQLLWLLSSGRHAMMIWESWLLKCLLRTSSATKTGFHHRLSWKNPRFTTKPKVVAGDGSPKKIPDLSHVFFYQEYASYFRLFSNIPFVTTFHQSVLQRNKVAFARCSHMSSPYLI